MRPWCNFATHVSLLHAAMRQRLGDGFQKFITHDLRRSVRTRLEAMPGVSHVVAERCLAHVSGGSYNQYDYIREKRDAMEAWSEEVLRIVGEAHVIHQEAREDDAEAA